MNSRAVSGHAGKSNMHYGYEIEQATYMEPCRNHSMPQDTPYKITLSKWRVQVYREKLLQGSLAFTRAKAAIYKYNIHYKKYTNKATQAKEREHGRNCTQPQNVVDESTSTTTTNNNPYILVKSPYKQRPTRQSGILFTCELLQAALETHIVQTSVKADAKRELLHGARKAHIVQTLVVAIIRHLFCSL